MIEKAEDDYGKVRIYKGSYVPNPNPKGKVKINSSYGDIKID
ncbi:MAG: hypothetical protein ACJATA_000654 [Sphingobacteriales bacterium]|jgi:hypothetical protein